MRSVLLVPFNVSLFSEEVSTDSGIQVEPASGVGGGVSPFESYDTVTTELYSDVTRG